MVQLDIRCGGKMGVCLLTGNISLQIIHLSPDHPESLYQQFLNNGLVPENYGLRSFSEEMAEEFKDWNRDRLISEILYLRKTVLNYEKYG